MSYVNKLRLTPPMARYLIDSDVMIDVSRRNDAAATYGDSLDDIRISIITAHELIIRVNY